MSGGNVSKRAELRLMMIRIRDGHQRRKHDNVAKVCEVIRSNRRLTVREVAEEASMSKTLCHEILP
jgi:hypothetical protein